MTDETKRLARKWAEDDRLWNTQEVVEANLVKFFQKVRELDPKLRPKKLKMTKPKVRGRQIWEMGVAVVRKKNNFNTGTTWKDQTPAQKAGFRAIANWINENFLCK